VREDAVSLFGCIGGGSPLVLASGYIGRAGSQPAIMKLAYTVPFSIFSHDQNHTAAFS
jgi:hypothetical protein